MVTQILLLLPWILTTCFLTFILIRNKRHDHDHLDDELFSLRVAMIDGKAYWVHDNVFYQTDIDEDGEPMFDDAEPIDTASLSEYEVSKLFYILDSLEER